MDGIAQLGLGRAGRYMHIWLCWKKHLLNF